MKIEIKNQQPLPDSQFVPHHVDIWYDRHSRNWVVQLMDKYGNQITSGANYVYSKPEALNIKKQYEKEYNLR
ncbi:MAG: hypothetical protein K0S41_2034 [Anaerocolumna sp.]|jgi:ribosomal protein S24E|nr:hypothetical protein [Anaerocolumna sp.]